MNWMARWRIEHLILCGVALGAAAPAAMAQQSPLPASRAPAYRHRVLGVYDIGTGEPIEGVSVTDLKSGTNALTTKTGTVSLIFLPDGGSLIRVRKLGYEPGGQFVSISPADTAPVTILLTASAVALPGMVTTDSAPHYKSVTLKDFEVRRKTGPGHFIAEAELRKNDTRKMQDVVRRFPGLQIVCSRAGFYSCEAVAGRMPRKGRNPGGDCRYTVFVDGVPLRDPDLTKLNVIEFAGVEQYTAGERIPTRYNMNGNPCGVLLFWSREG